MHFSTTSKMPCPCWSLPIALCKSGTRYHKDTSKPYICRVCYARMGPGSWDPHQQLLWKNYEEYISDPIKWVKEMSQAIQFENNCLYFRFFHCGDLQSTTMLGHICEIADNCPSTKFWLPTIEKKMVEQHIKTRNIPQNLVVRVSSPLVDGEFAQINHPQVAGSRVIYKHVDDTMCLAYTHTEHACKACRRCWDAKEQVSYPLHQGKNLFPKQTAKRLGLI